MMKLVAVLAMLGTLVVTVAMVVFCLAMGANASPADIQVLKWWMGGLSVLGLTGIVAAIVLLRAGQPNRAAVAAVVPAMIMGLIVLVELLT